MGRVITRHVVCFEPPTFGHGAGDWYWVVRGIMVVLFVDKAKLMNTVNTIIASPFLPSHFLL